jgi:anaerobic sulfite reductase subunit B
MKSNPYLPKPHKIIDIVRETESEYTFKIESEKKPTYGQFYQVSIPRIGEAPISVCDFGEGFY